MSGCVVEEAIVNTKRWTRRLPVGVVEVQGVNGQTRASMSQYRCQNVQSQRETMILDVQSQSIGPKNESTKEDSLMAEDKIKVLVEHKKFYLGRPLRHRCGLCASSRQRLPVNT